MKKRKVEGMVVEIEEPGRYYSVTGAAARLGRTRQAVSAAIHKKRILAVETPWGLLIHERQIDDYKASVARPDAA
jgi:hypothetical protein